jgi:hypothetical protein
MNFRPAFALTLILAAPLFAGQARASNPELYCVAVPTMELTPEAAKGYNVARNADRGLLTVTIVKKGKNGATATLPGQVYAGAINQNNLLYNIPIREVHDGDSVYYLGEFHVTTPDTLRFLVNANVLGRPMKSEFSREFYNSSTSAK